MADTKHELGLAVLQLKSLLAQKEALEVKIAKQRQKVAAWEILANTDDGSPSDTTVYLESLIDIEGLSDACRTVMRASSLEWMTTSDIQRDLREIGFPLEKYKAPNGAITTTVNRMSVGADPVVIAKRSSNPNVTFYKWVGPKYGAPNSLANQDADGRLTQRAQAIKNFKAAVDKRRLRTP
jgi:hypothetical protein